MTLTGGQAEIAQLLKEAALLQQKLARLQRAGGDASTDEPTLEQRSLENVLVREQLRNQKFLVAGLKSALAGDTVCAVAYLPLGC